MARVAKLFTNGRSQAVRLPKDCHFEGSEVLVAKLDDMVILYPAGKKWPLLDRALGNVTDDFMKTRDQPGVAERRKRI